MKLSALNEGNFGQEHLANDEKSYCRMQPIHFNAVWIKYDVCIQSAISPEDTYDCTAHTLCTTMYKNW